MNDIKEGMHAKVKGVAQYDRFTDSVTIIANILEYTNRVVPKDIRVDVAPVKRIELHAQTKMSTLDGIDSVRDYVDFAQKMDRLSRFMVQNSHLLMKQKHK